MDILGKIAEINKSSQPADTQSVSQLINMLEEITASYGALVDTVDILTKQNMSLAAKCKWLDEHVCYLLGKDEDYVKAAEELLAKATEGNTDVKADSVSTNLPA